MHEARPRVLVVDDDPLQLELLETVLPIAGFEVITTASPMGVSNLVRRRRPDYVLLDLDLPAVPGDRLLTLARASAPEETLFVLYSACDTAKLQVIATQLCADGWISKTTAATDVGEELQRIRAERDRSGLSASSS